MLNWSLLYLAIAAEVAGTSCVKIVASEGLARPLPIAGLVFSYSLMTFLLVLAMRSIDMSIAYAIWSGFGMALVTMVGVAAFGEALTPLRAICIILIIVGTVGLSLAAD